MKYEIGKHPPKSVCLHCEAECLLLVEDFSKWKVIVGSPDYCGTCSLHHQDGFCECCTRAYEAGLKDGRK